MISPLPSLRRHLKMSPSIIPVWSTTRFPWTWPVPASRPAARIVVHARGSSSSNAPRTRRDGRGRRGGTSAAFCAASNFENSSRHSSRTRPRPAALPPSRCSALCPLLAARRRALHRCFEVDVSRVQLGPGHRRRRHRRFKNAPRRRAPAREESAAAQRRRGRAEARRARRSVVWVARAPLPHLPRGASHLGPTSAEPHERHERPEAPGLRLGAPLIANRAAAALRGGPVVRRPASVGARGRHVLGVHLLLLRPEHPSGLVHRPRQRELGHGAGRVPSAVARLSLGCSP